VGRGPRLFFQKVPEGKATKNRVHLDVRAAPGLEAADRMAALEAEADRLIALGGTRVSRIDPGGMDAGHVVMRDPEGNEFCLD
jgi:Glyoxalase-like domain